MANRLAAESSPYLLQHAGNPVDWHPWDEVALAEARSRDRPILLSVGYSACHWCHVMERESFEDPDVARLMNELFVSIKVDREERPDIDQIYMKAVQAMTGGGGWPMTVFLTPEGVPYYGGTYFPPVPRHGMPSFTQVLRAAAEAYRSRPDEVRAAGDRLVEALRSASLARPETDDGADIALLDRAYRTLSSQYDPVHGGFGTAPKFPQPVTLEVLLRRHVRTGEPEPLDMLLHTLRRMAAGGIRDHLGGGFHRYSVDARWLVPHFEKMLYDNALLARAYLDAFRRTGSADLRAVCESTLDYALRDLAAPDGGFYAARDADSEGEEGLYYLWTKEEIERALAPDEARLFARCYDVTAAGNFEGRNILHLAHDIEALAGREGVEPAALEAMLASARSALLAAREAREAPMRDEKVLTGWNGMVLRAFAEAGGALARADYLAAATRGVDFLLSALRPDGRLLHVFGAGRPHVPAFLEDHGALGNALTSLHEATLDPRWLAEIRWVCDELLARFWDDDVGIFHDTADDAEPLVVRPRDPMDNATPSGASLAAELLVRAGHLFDEERYRSVALRSLERDAATAARFGPAFGRYLAVVDRSLAEPVEVAVIGARDDPATRALLRSVVARFERNLTVTGKGPGEDVPDVPLLAGRDVVDGRPAAYVCRRYTCRAPVTEPEALDAELQAVDGLA